MADKPEGMGAGTEALLFLAGLAALIALWWFNGGPGHADLRGMFLQPPAPVGTGGAYGPDPLKAVQGQGSGGSYNAATSSDYQTPTNNY